MPKAGAYFGEIISTTQNTETAKTAMNFLDSSLPSIHLRTDNAVPAEAAPVLSIRALVFAAHKTAAETCRSSKRLPMPMSKDAEHSVIPMSQTVILSVRYGFSGNVQ